MQLGDRLAQAPTCPGRRAPYFRLPSHLSVTEAAPCLQLRQSSGSACVRVRVHCGESLDNLDETPGTHRSGQAVWAEKPHSWRLRLASTGTVGSLA